VVKPARVTYYFDEDILRLAHTVARLRTDCTYPGDPGVELNKRHRPPCPIPKGSKDWMWLPAVTERGWLIVTRDHNIRENPAERRLVRETGARMVALSGEDSRYTLLSVLPVERVGVLCVIDGEDVGGAVGWGGWSRQGEDG
jgi:hypothetical protein